LKTEKEAKALFRGEISWKKPLLIMGGGSNILFCSDFRGTILCPDFRGIRIEEHDKDHVIISAGAGIKWDKLVEWSVEKGFYGLENLSLIPGLVGATPVQNIGAYGAEAKDLIEKVRAINSADGSVRIFSNQECGFGYRESVFKNSEKGRHLITRVYYKLKIKPSLNLGYSSLKEEADKLGDITLKNVRQAVINIRRRKLPDPEVIGNAGSFFKNPLASKPFSEQLMKRYPGMPVFQESEGKTKLAAGWLIEQCGWKGKRIGDAGVHEKQALVIVNYGNASGIEIFDLSEKIRKSVFEKFGVELEREVEVVGAD
jgi:UDP-N-acetylmuramate dehydrogenase